MNQISGINITSYYMTYIFINSLKFPELPSRILAAGGSVDYLIFACLAYFVRGERGTLDSTLRILRRIIIPCPSWSQVQFSNHACLFLPLRLSLQS